MDELGTPLASAPPKALVTNGEGRATVAACRCLSAAGYRVAVVAAARPAASHWSRSCDERLRLPDPVRSPAAFIEELEHVVRTGAYAVLLPGSDAALIAISSARERLEPHVRIGLPSQEAVEASLDKLRLIEVASAAGLGAPATIVCHRVEDAVGAARELGFPAVLKPRRSIVDDGSVRNQLSTRLVFDEAQLGTMAPEYGLPFLVQGREPGAVYSCSGVMLPHGLITLVTTRYLRTWPPEGGEVAFSVTVQTPPDLSRAVEEMLSALGWRGLFELELIRRSDGSFVAIDLNPRLYGSLAAAVAAGAPLPAIWCDWLRTGDATSPMTRTGLMYRWEEGDLRHFFWQLRRGQLGRATAVLRPHRGLLHAYFRPSDPGPLLARAVQVVRIAGQRQITKASPRGGTGSPILRQS